MGKACSLTSSNWASASQLGRQGGHPFEKRPPIVPASKPRLEWHWPSAVAGGKT